MAFSLRMDFLEDKTGSESLSISSLWKWKPREVEVRQKEGKARKEQILRWYRAGHNFVINCLVSEDVFRKAE